MKKVELISNIVHYYHTALALEGAGLLGHYITGPCALESESWLERAPGPLRRLWLERRMKGLPDEKIKRLFLPEIVHKGVRKLTHNGELANSIHNQIYAREASWAMGECDAVHFVHSLGWIAARKAKRNGIKVISDMREEHPAFQKRILSEEAGQLGISYVIPGSSYKDKILEEIDLANFIFCPSRHAKRTFLANGIPEEKVIVLPYGANITPLERREERDPNQPFTVLFLGNVCMRKGIHTLLDAYKLAGLKNARLVLAGPIDPLFTPVLERYEGLFEAPGPIKRHQTPNWYRKADVFVLPSLADSYGLSVTEAMASGVPVIVSENTGSSEVITDGQDGFIVPIRDPRAIAGRLTRLYEDRALCAAMGAAAIEKVKTQTWEKYREGCVKAYDQIFAD